MTSSGAATVSVVVTFFDRERYLAEAIESVLAQHVELELLLVDDGSRDASAEVARRYVPPGRLVHQENRGAAGAANTGIRHASGELVAFCDSDDVWLPGKLVRQLAAFAADPSLHLVFGHAEEFLSPEIEPGTERTRAPRGVLPAKVPSAVLVRRSFLAEVGPFDETLTNSAWLEWYARAAAHGAHEAMLPDVAFRRRIHQRNNFALQEDAAGSYLRALRPLVQMRRHA